MPSASSAPCGQVDVGRRMLRPIAARRDDGARDDDHARAGDDALLDRLLEADVGVARALGAEVAHRREAGEQRVARVVRRAGDAERERLVQHLIVPRRLVVRMQQQVRVPLDEPGQQRRAGQVDRRRAGGCADVGRRADGGDACRR